jgi:hypothetical protein
MSVYTAVFPTRSIGNLEHCVNSLIKNSRNLSEVIIIWDGSNNLLAQLPKFESTNVSVHYFPNSGLDVYGMFNYGALLCKTDYMLLVNDDMYFPSGWDQNLQLSSDLVVTFVVVEPGWVQVNKINVLRAFGFTWDDFKLEEFEKYVSKYKKRGAKSNGKIGWYMPVIFPKALFMEAGQYPTEPPFPQAPNDITFFEKLQTIPKVKFVQVNSPVYHFQRLSQRVEGEQPTPPQKKPSALKRLRRWLPT